MKANLFMMKGYMEFIKKLFFNILLISCLSSCEENGLGSGTDFINDFLPDCYESSVRQLDPVVYFRFDEKSSESTAKDSGSAKNVPVNTSVTFENPGVFSRKKNFAVTFNGSSNLNLGNNSYLQITGDQTLEFWVYPTAFGARRNFFAKAYGGEGTITLEPTGLLNYFYGTGGGNTSPYQGFGSVTTLSLNVWSHVVLVRDLGASSLKWYINGVQTATVGATYPAAATSSLSMLLGAGYVSNFIGSLDEFALYDKALSSSQVQEHYQLATGSCPN